jgi:hypothetical protein
MHLQASQPIQNHTSGIEVERGTERVNTANTNTLVPSETVAPLLLGDLIDKPTPQREIEW